MLSKLSKEKGCKELADWTKPCENHLYWSAATTFSGNGQVIRAKFKTFLSHIINKHSSLSDPLFNKCGHGEIRPSWRWLHAGMTCDIKYMAIAQSYLIHVPKFTVTMYIYICKKCIVL